MESCAATSKRRGKRTRRTVSAGDENDLTETLLESQKAWAREIDDSVLLTEIRRRGIDHTEMARNVWGRYDNEGQIGEGSTARVYSVKHTRSGARYALKEINLNTTAADVNALNDLESLRNELEIMQRVRHRNIVCLHEFYESSRALWLVLELVEGGEVGARLAQIERYTEATARLVFTQLVDGVSYLHNHGIVHRDLKLENLLLKDDRPETDVKIADLGLATFVPGASEGLWRPPQGGMKRMRDLTEPWGTPTHMAPEQIDEAYGPQVDLWACGCILFELLCGSSPFNPSGRPAADFWIDDDVCPKLDAKIHKGGAGLDMQKGPWKDVSADAKDLVARLLRVDPAARDSAAEVMKHQWLREEAAPPPLVRTQTEIRRSRLSGGAGRPATDPGPGGGGGAGAVGEAEAERSGERSSASSAAAAAAAAAPCSPARPRRGGSKRAAGPRAKRDQADGGGSGPPRERGSKRGQAGKRGQAADGASSSAAAAPPGSPPMMRSRSKKAKNPSPRRPLLRSNRS